MRVIGFVTALLLALTMVQPSVAGTGSHDGVTPQPPKQGLSCVDGMLPGTATTTGCFSALAAVKAVCPVAVVTGGAEPISGSACAIAVLTASFFCKVSIPTVFAGIAHCATKVFSVADPPLGSMSYKRRVRRHSEHSPVETSRSHASWGVL